MAPGRTSAATAPNPEHATAPAEMPSRKRWREDPPLSTTDFKDLARVKRHVLLSALRSARN
eukprot:9327892-Lingulodinium_polyedra.AAC.1